MGLFDKKRKDNDTKKETELFEYSTGEYQKLDTEGKRRLFYDLFTKAYSDHVKESENMDKRDKLYFGDNFIEKSPNSTSKGKPDDANTVPNICYELIEAEKEMSIPIAVVNSRTKNKTIQERMIRNMLKFCKDELDMENLQDRTEQTTYTQGHSYGEVLWNPNYYFGGFPEIEEIHPKNIIPQPGVYILQKMDYFFIVRTRTKNYIKKKYGKDLNLNTMMEHYPSFNSMGKSSSSSSELISEITAYYRDCNDNVGRLVFSQDTTFEDNPNIYAMSFKQCMNEECKEDDGTDVILPLTKDKCPLCGKELTIVTSDEEKLLKEVKKPSNTKDQYGKPIYETIPAGTKVKLFNPKIYPIVQRINVPKPFSFGGHSDIDTIADKQNALKKTATKVDEKINGSGTIITIPKMLQKKLTNSTYEILPIDNPQDLAMIQVKDLKAPINDELTYMATQRESAKNTLGITNSWLGQPDPTAQSGKAKQVQVQQSGGRFASKMVNKYKFYKDMYKLLFYFMVVFSDDPIYLGAEDDLDDGEADYFDKHLLLEKDKEGNYFYDTNYTIKSENVPDFTNDKQFLFEIVLKLMDIKQSNGLPLINPKQGLKILKQLGFPLAETIINEAEIEADNMIAGDKLGINNGGQQLNPEMILAAMQSLPKEQQEEFMNMSPEEQEAFIQELIGGNPQQNSVQPGI